MTAERRRARATVYFCCLLACGDDDGGAQGTTDGSGSGSGSESNGGTTLVDASVDGSGSGDPGSDTTPIDEPDPPLPCPDTWNCNADRDGDDRPSECDNAPDQYNPDQSDVDFDGIGDVVDLCPTVQGLTNAADSDKDGLGNDCDTCRRPAAFYDGDAMLPAHMAVRNVALTGDRDGDGIGDACDNCPSVPNCMGYGDNLGTWMPGDAIDEEDPKCLVDTDLDGIGDVCEGEQSGFGDGDDFDQDGIANGVDGCPRLPAGYGECAGAADCPADSVCTGGVCDHPDPDGDGVGSECDACPFTANPEQIVEGLEQEADADGDFIGNACEACVEQDNPRPIGFYDVAAGGYCCTTVYQGETLADPDGQPLEPGDLPVDPAGLLELPPGCEQALTAAGVAEATRLLPEDVGSVAALWDYRCVLPARDQDYDGLQDACDFCPYAFDPTNAPYVDENGMVWPQNGKYCYGDYACMDD